MRAIAAIGCGLVLAACGVKAPPRPPIRAGEAAPAPTSTSTPTSTPAPTPTDQTKP